MGYTEIIKGLATQHRHDFDLARAVYLTVLHRLFASGSDRAAEVWKENYSIPGAKDLALHQLRFLGRLTVQVDGSPPLMEGPD